MAQLSLRRVAASLLIALLVSAATAPVLAADWNQWRGPGRDGHLDGAALPAAWPEALTPKWQVAVGEGHSSPVVAGDRVFLFSRQDEQEVLRALTLKDGRELWKAAYPAPYQVNPVAIPHGKGPKSTPVVAGDKVCTYGITGILSCHATADGKLLWRKDFSSYEQGGAEWCGHSLSPLVDGGLIYIAYGSDLASGAIAAFELETGKLRWELKDLKPSYASPMIFEVGGQRQLVTLTRVAIVGIDPADGKLLWQHPYSDRYGQNIPTPLQVGDQLFFGNIENGSFGASLARGEAGWTVTETWKQAALPWYMSTPVSDGRLIYGMTDKNKGQLFALEPKTGNILWRSPGRQGENVLLSLAGENVLTTDTNGELKVWKKAGDGLELLKTYTVADSPIWAHAAWAGNLVLVKDKETLRAHALEAPPAPKDPAASKGR